MKKEVKYEVFRYFILIFLSIVFYFIYYLLSNNSRDIWTSILLGIANIPINIVITGVLINNILNRREMYREKKQINMVVGIFYNEIGIDILRIFVKADKNIDKIIESCLIKKDFSSEDYEDMKRRLERNEFCVDLELIDLNYLIKMLNERIYIIINLVINPVLTNNQFFIDTVLSVLNLREELNYRITDGRFKKDEDKELLIEEINRCYRSLTLRWIKYMKNLSEYYPCIFEKSLINSPFDIRYLKTKD